MSLSVIEPITPAFDRMKRILFQPVDFGKWLRLAFCAFLMGLASGGGGGGGAQGVGGGGGRGGAGGGGHGGMNFATAWNWFHDHLPVILLIGLVLLVLAIAIGLLLTWISSRARFMFLDGVVRNRGAVVEPWHEYRREGNSLFKFRICLGFAIFFAILMVLGVGMLIAWPDIRNQDFGGGAVAAIATCIVMLLGVVIIMGVLSVFLADFVVPIMYLRRIGVMAAWREFSSSLLAGNTGTFVLYVLAKIGIGLVTAMLAVLAVLCTCCIAVIPYVGSVILLPLTVFTQAYPLYFIEQFGPSWQIFPPEKPPKSPQAASPFGDGAFS